MDNLPDFVKVLLRSNRVKVMIFALILSFFQKYLPDMVPSEETLHWIYGIVITFIIGDTVRPIDENKLPANLTGEGG